MTPRDPRYRPFRIGLWALYFGVIVFALAVVMTSIVRHLRGPHRPPATGALPTRAALRVCVADLEALNHEQNQRAWRLGDDVGEGDAIARWETWAREWEQRVDDLSDRCRLDAGDPDPQGFGGRQELARARDAVLALHRAYRAQVNRFAQEEANLARGARRDLDAAREAVSRPPERH
ncbi:hypothetical protein [Anaeromyxobacter oryzae]|uniref:Uncharacterized protein n=1 Tax=Anaeromyxobacter oryzae TaxID=2918170 RepID=A0ABN6N3H1_9BACT|nr:hypothetical protein [Anaeromyxobacter oryzae]BDG06585.1 hypothetical protein AMOR_55810 [Anaeromyxobacter oryzae]